MIDYSDHYLIVGAGVSGLATARRFKEMDIPFQVVDRNPNVGGLWDWRVPGNGMYRSAHLVSSKERTAFPDLPMPESYPDFPSNEQALTYLRGFANRFNLNPHIECGRTVRQINPRRDGRGWEVRLDRDERRCYQGVVMAIGHLWDPIVPEFPGSFAGHCLHSAHYKSREMFADRRVVIVGLGNSACDIACDAVMAGAERVIVSPRGGAWFVPKYILGRPADEAGGWLTGWLPRRLRRWLDETALRLLTVRPERFGLPAPQHRLHERVPVVNSQFLYHLGHGLLHVKPSISALNGREIAFADGTSEIADILVYCTGYRFSFPFIDDRYLNLQENLLPEFLLHLFHPERNDLFTVGLHKQSSGGWSVPDMQARALAHFLVAIQREPDTAQALRASLPRLHRKVRREAEKWFSRGNVHFALQIEEKSYKKALEKLIDSDPRPHKRTAGIMQVGRRRAKGRLDRLPEPLTPRT